MRQPLLLGLLLLSWSPQSQAQILPKAPQLELETGSYGVSDRVPFWLRANQASIVPLQGSLLTGRIGLEIPYAAADSAHKPKPLDWGMGLTLVGNAGQTTQFVLPQAYLKAHWGPIELYIGRRPGIVGLVDTLLTSGSYAWSGNALPLPKIQLATLGYVPLGFTKGVLAVNALFNHGWFTNGFVRHSYLHQKALYLRIGKPANRVQVYLGGNHEVQWGGYAPALVGVPGLSDNQDGQFESNLAAYYHVVSTTRGTGYVPPQGIISIDQGNRIGNHLGSFDGGVEVRLGGYQLLAYRQNLYETGSLFYLTNLADGLHGLRLRRLQPVRRGFSVEQVLVEFLSTKSQGGSEFVIEDPYRRGRNDYFNHSQYQDGWTYQGRALGTPFLTPQTEVNPALPVGRAIANNRVSLWHVGLAGRLGEQGAWLAKLSYSQNFGTYDIPYPATVPQFSGVVSVVTPLYLPGLGELQVRASLAVDAGQLLTNATGCYLGLRKRIGRSMIRGVLRPGQVGL